MMNQPILHLARRTVVTGSIFTLCLASISCKLPPRQAWNNIQQRGLIPVLFSTTAGGNPDASVNNGSTASANNNPAPLKVQAVKTAEVASIPFATPVPGRSGYVFSPHTPGHKLIDVREYAAGAEARCPYTMQPFMVPNFATLAEASKPVPAPQPQNSIAEVVSRNPEPRSRDQAEPAPLLQPDPVAVQPAVSHKPAPEEIPYGSRVAGRPGFVNSPFAAKNQLVDVAGIAPGVEVKCPYSNRLFRVPEPLPEEVTPAPATIIPPASPVPTPPEATEPTAPPAPVQTPAPAPPAPPEANPATAPSGT